MKVASFSADHTELAQLAFTERLIATGSSDGVVRVWDARNTSTILLSYEGHKRGVRQVILDDRKLVSLSGSGKVHLCDLRDPDASTSMQVRFFGNKVLYTPIITTCRAVIIIRFELSPRQACGCAL